MIFIKMSEKFTPLIHRGLASSDKNGLKQAKRQKSDRSFFMPLKAFLLCAGEGSRFRPHTHILPKVLIPFLNIPLCAYNLYLLKTLGVRKWTANIHCHPNLQKKNLTVLAQKSGLDQPTFSFEAQVLGSAGGLLKVKDFFEGENHFFYLNGDSFIWPGRETDLLDFYSTHIESGALASFLVRPAKKQPALFKKGYIYAENKTICAFSKAPTKNLRARPYEFSGLALFSQQIFKEIRPGAFHIFKDVLASLVSSKRGLRVHPVPHLRLLDMNQENTYLQGTQVALNFLKEHREEGFLQKILNMYTPFWRRFEGDSWFSAQPVDKPSPTDILFCGPKVKGLKNLSVTGFAVLGERAILAEPLCMEKSVLGQGVYLNQNLQNTLKLLN